MILVVDDDPGIRLLFISAFQDEGFAVREARDGIEAIESCEEDVPDLMILDLNMPRLDGVALLEEMEHRGWPHFPVLAVTAQPRRAKAVADRVDDVVMKPVDLDELLSRATRLIHRVPDASEAPNGANGASPEA